MYRVCGAGVGVRAVDINMYKRAINIAKRSQHRMKHGAILMHPKLGAIFSGFNRNDVTQIHNPISERAFALHAECDIARKVPRGLLRGSSILVVRVTPVEGSVRLSKPCKKCCALLSAFKVRSIYYSLDGGGLGRIDL